jgi:CHAT domain-containing protein
MKFPPLPASRKEADEIASLWRRHAPDSSAGGAVLKLTGARAAEEAFKRLAPGRKILHLATHGFFLDERCPSALGTRPGGEPRAGGEPPPPLIGENPLLLSGLVLAGANRREAPGSSADAEDGILTAEEIASLDLSGVEWAVLSACETGLGKVQAGEGVLGLRRAFQVAGAGTLIMSLWRVDDEAAREWMRRLYEGRLSGLSTAEAIREASLGMLEARRRAGRDTHPASWGAFVAAGDWR